MTTHLRQLPDGTRFVLVRTGQRFTLLRRETFMGKRLITVSLGEGAKDSHLHHSCHVKPILKATPCY